MFYAYISGIFGLVIGILSSVIHTVLSVFATRMILEVAQAIFCIRDHTYRSSLAVPAPATAAPAAVTVIPHPEPAPTGHTPGYLPSGVNIIGEDPKPATDSSATKTAAAPASTSSSDTAPATGGYQTIS